MEHFWEMVCNNSKSDTKLVLSSAVTNMTLEQFIKVYIDIGNTKKSRDPNKITFKINNNGLRIVTSCKKFNTYIKRYSFNSSDLGVKHIMDSIIVPNHVIKLTIGDLKKIAVYFKSIK